MACLPLQLPFVPPSADARFHIHESADCVPTMSMGSVYSLCRTIRNVDQLPLDIHKRAEFILDSRVRVQQSEQGLKTEDGEHGRRENQSSRAR